MDANGHVASATTVRRTMHRGGAMPARPCHRKAADPIRPRRLPRWPGPPPSAAAPAWPGRRSLSRRRTPRAASCRAGWAVRERGAIVGASLPPVGRHLIGAAVGAPHLGQVIDDIGVTGPVVIDGSVDQIGRITASRVDATAAHRQNSFIPAALNTGAVRCISRQTAVRPVDLRFNIGVF